MQHHLDLSNAYNLKSVVKSQQHLINKYLLKLNQQLQADFLFIAENDEEYTEASTLITVSKQHIIDNFSYPLAHSPCEKVFNSTVCVYPRNVANIFPQDEALTTMGIQGYLGLPLLRADNKPVGILVALFHQEVENIDLFTWSFEVFADHLSSLIQNTFINEKLLLQNRLLEEVGQAANIGHWELSKHTLQLYWSPQVYQILGLDKQDSEMPLSKAIDWFHPADRTKARAFFTKALNKEADVTATLRIQGPLQQSRTIICRVCEGVEANRIAGVLQDITAIRAMTEELYSSQKELHETEKMLQDIMDCSPAVIYVKDIHGKYLFINNKYTEALGVTRQQVIDHTDLDFLPREKAIELMKNDRRVIHSKTHHELEEEIPQPDGKKLYISEKFPLVNSKGEVYALCGISTDITLRRNQELQLRQSQKMEAIGQLAGGIAHDFNNQLASILGFAELIDASDSLPKIKNYIKHIILSADNSTDLIKKLLSFSRKDDAVEEYIDLNDLIRETIELLSHTLDKQISIESTFCCDAVSILANKSALQNALINLGLNARDAMPGGGRITIKACRIKQDKIPFPPGVRTSDQPYVMLEINDTGMGIPEKYLARIFEPFFTTKDVGKGTGMGLALVYGIIEGIGGFISVDSQLGQGTTFRLFLPGSEDKCSVEQPCKLSTDPVQTTKKTILIVDDESAIRTLCSEFLELLGYEGIYAENGKQAIDLYRQHQDKIDLVILDMIMPVMNGEETFLKLLSIDPDVVVIISSGYTANFSVDHLLKAGAKKLINKPFKLAELKDSIEEVTTRSR